MWRTIGWLMVASVIAIMLDPSPADLSQIEYGDKFLHVLAYLGMMLWLSQCYLSHRHGLLAAMLLAMGIGLEFLQGWSGYRTFEVADMLANSGGVLLGWLSYKTFLGTSLYRLEKLRL